MELRHLRYFTAVAEEQNVTRAAARLHVSQPPLSRQIRDLEEELGVELFKRTAKSVELTEAGKIFLNEARAVLLRSHQAVQAVRAVAKGARGEVRVGYAPSLTVEILPRALKLFEQEHPGTRVALHDCSTEEYGRKLLERKLDVALGVKPAGRMWRGVVFEKLASYPLYCAVAASHPLAKKRAISARQMKEERLIGYSRDEYPEYHAWLREIFRPFGFDPALAEEHDSVTSLIAAVEAGRGVAIATSSLRCLVGPRLKLLPIRPNLPPVIMGMMYIPPLSQPGEQFILAVRASR
ncbi:MAG TPA: LysR substrate-binding domain-containing protein [Candidatus Saccharimonadales bacterium]|jgi:DNA-binding transcriptional LysR family regulator|nr:LysR substrate-binding domain-containing protein [Candidatus Saccharimonadales bacterium]